MCHFFIGQSTDKFKLNLLGKLLYQQKSFRFLLNYNYE